MIKAGFVLPIFIFVSAAMATERLDPVTSPDSAVPADSSESLVPAALIKLPNIGDSAILVDKKSQTLKVYTLISHDFSYVDRYEKVLETACSTGEVAGRKALEGDKKTPEGIYFIKKLFEDRYLTPIYGKRAFTTDYPNVADRIHGRTGSAIWIHGTNRPLVPMDSNGCVAMRNKDVVLLDAYIKPDHTPIILAETLEYASAKRVGQERQRLIHFVDRWVQAMNQGVFSELVSFYFDDAPPDAVMWKEWRELRGRHEGRPERGKAPDIGEESLEERSIEPKKGGEMDPISLISILLSAENIGIYRQGDQLLILFDLVLTKRDHDGREIARLTVGKRKWFLENRILGFSDTNRPESHENRPESLDAGESQSFHGNGATHGSGTTVLISADVYQTLSISTEPDEEPLIAGVRGLLGTL